MKKILFLLLFLFNYLFSFSQELSLETIFSGQLFPKSIQGIKSMKDGLNYVVHDQNGIQKNSYQTQNFVETIYSGEFDDYAFSNDESKLLINENSQPIYRHSLSAKYFVVDLKTKQKTEIFNGKMIQEPLFSPDNTKVAFVFENNLYYQDLSNNTVTQITQDGKKTQIINGICDWVYEEEFGFVRHFEWTKDGNSLVFVKFDESQVPEIRLPIYHENLYPKELVYKYPKAGEKNSEVSLHTYNLSSKKTQKVELNSVENYYLISLKQTKKNNEILLISSNRHQNKVDVSVVNTQNYSVNKLFTETDNAWIETDAFKVQYLDNNDFLWSSEKDGYRHIYLYENSTKKLNQLTKGNFEVTEFYGFNPKNNTLYYQSTENGSINRGIYSLNIKTQKKTPLMLKDGVNSAEFSSDFSYFININSSKYNPPVYSLCSGDGKILKELETNSELQNKLKNYNLKPVEFSEISNSKGYKLNTWTIKPKNFDPNKKYPVLMYVYGGPNSQEAKNDWDSFYYLYFQYIANQGYIISCTDGRGTGAKGAEFKKSIYKQLGKYEIEDQIDVAKYLGKLPYVDSSRIGMMGWSFGGYMSSLALTKSDVFKASIAVAPVTNWRYYDTVYTEKFLQTPQENPSGYDENSPINYAENLKGNYLLIHGTADDNVHFQNSVEMSEALVQQAKQFDYFVYTDKNHGIYGGKTRFHLFKKITNFIKEKL